MEKTQIKIAALQMESVIGDVNANREKVRELLKRGLIDKSPNIIVLPEVWTVGWDCIKFRETAETADSSETLKLLKNLAKKYNSYILGGSFIEKDNGNYYNTCPVITPEGTLLTKYRKNHLFSYYGYNEGSYVTAGENPVLIDILGIKIGLTICFDIRFPEIYRAYRKAGADVLVNMAAWPLSRKNHWLALTAARAIENQCFMVALTQSGTLDDGVKNLGHSLIYNYNGEVLAQLTEGEGIIYAEFSTDDMSEFRKRCTVLKNIHPDYEVIKC